MPWAGGIRCIEVGTGQREIGDEDRQDGVWGGCISPSSDTGSVAISKDRHHEFKTGT
jgi:hypothetical protein